jgi:putative drug exporter of the RND superfamily
VLASLAILVVLAIPFLDVRFGFPDAGNDPVEKTSRQAHDLAAAGFGPGAAYPLLVTAELPTPGDVAPAASLAADIQATPGVASVDPPVLDPAGGVALITVVPTTGAQDPQTEDLVRTLRDDVIPPAVAGTGVTAHVGGVTAGAIDTTDAIASKLPLLIGGVVLLSFLLLMVVFRSILVPVKAAVMNLLSIAAAYGVVAYVLQGGWAGKLIGIDTETPLPAFIPVLMFAILFGLSMDYEVFLMSRIREHWLRSDESSSAVVEGLAATARVITAAAAIMVCVFLAFVLDPDVILKVIGIGLATAIFVDATVVRMLLVPATMQLLGRSAWWLPTTFDRYLPELHVEGRVEPELQVPSQRAGEQSGTETEPGTKTERVS